MFVATTALTLISNITTQEIVDETSFMLSCEAYKKAIKTIAYQNILQVSCFIPLFHIVFAILPYTQNSRENRNTMWRLAIEITTLMGSFLLFYEWKKRNLLNNELKRIMEERRAAYHEPMDPNEREQVVSRLTEEFKTLGYKIFS